MICLAVLQESSWINFRTIFYIVEAVIAVVAVIVNGLVILALIKNPNLSGRTQLLCHISSMCWLCWDSIGNTFGKCFLGVFIVILCLLAKIPALKVRFAIEFLSIFRYIWCDKNSKRRSHFWCRKVALTSGFRWTFLIHLLHKGRFFSRTVQSFIC